MTAVFVNSEHQQWFASEAGANTSVCACVCAYVWLSYIRVI